MERSREHTTPPGEELTPADDEDVQSQSWVWIVRSDEDIFSDTVSFNGEWMHAMGASTLTMEDHFGMEFYECQQFAIFPCTSILCTVSEQTMPENLAPVEKCYTIVMQVQLRKHWVGGPREEDHWDIVWELSESEARLIDKSLSTLTAPDGSGSGLIERPPLRDIVRQQSGRPKSHGSASDRRHLHGPTSNKRARQDSVPRTEELSACADIATQDNHFLEDVRTRMYGALTKSSCLGCSCHYALTTTFRGWSMKSFDHIFGEWPSVPENAPVLKSILALRAPISDGTRSRDVWRNGGKQLVEVRRLEAGERDDQLGDFCSFQTLSNVRKYRFHEPSRGTVLNRTSRLVFLECFAVLRVPRVSINRPSPVPIITLVMSTGYFAETHMELRVPGAFLQDGTAWFQHALDVRTRVQDWVKMVYV